ncbi:beta-xylosidase [Sphingomonas sp. CD22]|uniref:GH39 family glycosyl hydrolase n=1 Tax=Sphingomonas sp. CD22 TaxID=3100214 RepID=UPI002ADFB93B|nr:beta-xylosidase [Sphingomonas sp. CD22]MEA1085601.1 beta-xylosidase [Sphingomonas sp. CD22]
MTTLPFRFGAGALLCLAAAASAAPAPEPVRAIEVDVARAAAPIDRAFDLSVGSDFAGTLIRPDSLAQLDTAVRELGFRYVRFHDVFTDALGTVKMRDGRIVYDWTKIDQLYDAMLARKIKPFVELGFTPDALKTSNQTIFYWKGNTSHPQAEGWARLIDAYVRHLRQRYGAGEVRSWYFEVWNEPNLAGFWEKGDKAAYLSLYESSARTIKAIDPALRVGGPATAGAAWVPDLLDYAAARKVPIDFVTTHTYGVDGGFLDEKGEDDNRLSTNPDAIVGDVRRVRAEIASSKFPGLPLYFTEWSASYNPRDPVHDSYVSAPYILTKLLATRGIAQGMSYWTYSDLFEEAGPPPTPFHGGFGLMNREGIRKPAWFAYKYLHALSGPEIALADAQALATTEGGRTNVLVWNWQQPKQTLSNRPFFTRQLPATAAAAADLHLTHLAPGRYRLTVHRTGYQNNDAHSRYLAMGSPKTLTPAQIAELQALTTDTPEIARVVQVGRDGGYTLRLPMRSNDVVLATLQPVASGN